MIESYLNFYGFRDIISEDSKIRYFQKVALQMPLDSSSHQGYKIVAMNTGLVRT